MVGTALIVQRMYDGSALASGDWEIHAFGGRRISGGGYVISWGSR